MNNSNRAELSNIDLQTMDSRYRILVENSPFCIHEIDLSGKIISMNPAGLKMISCSSESEVCGTDYLDFVDDNNRGRISDLMQRAFDGESNSFEFTGNADGPIKFFSSNFIPITDESGKVVKLMGITQDITERRITELAIKESQEQLQMVISNIDEIVYSVDINETNPFSGQLMFISPQVKKLLGYTSTEFLSNPSLWFSLLHPDDIEKVKDMTMALIESGEAVTRIYRMKQKETGKYLWLEDRVLPKLGKSGEVVGFVGGARDITGRMASEQALRDSEEKYRNLFEKAPVGIGLADMKGNLIVFNDTILIPGGYSRADAMNLNVEDLYFDKEDRKAVHKEFARTGTVERNEVRFKRKDGTPYHASLSMTSIKLDGKRCLMAIVEDISSQKIVEEERENLIAELDRFVYSASHDMSAPLKSIRGLVNVSKMENDPDTLEMYFDKMEESIGKLEDFIQEIINYSRNSRLSIEVENIKLQELTDEILDNLKYSTGFEKITVEKDFSALKTVATDRFRLKIVLNNLISNAIKFHNVKLIKNARIDIRSYLLNGKPCIEVADNGMGIAKDNLDKIFDMFYRGSLDSNGSGLGLYIAKESAHNIGGSIQVESKVNKGSKFILVLGESGKSPKIRNIVNNGRK